MDVYTKYNEKVYILYEIEVSHIVLPKYKRDLNWDLKHEISKNEILLV